MMYIYKITNIINNKSYIGKCENDDIISYWKSHIRTSLTNNKKVLYKAFNKYGIDSFVFETLYETNDKKKLKDKEIYFIEKFNTFLGEGYNCTIGGDGGDTLSNHPNKKEIFKRSSETFKKNKSGWTGKVIPEEMRKQISETLKKYEFTNDHKENISKSLIGREFSEEHREKLRICNIGKKNPMCGKKAWCNGLNKENSEILKKSSKKASKTIQKQFENGRIVWNKNKQLGPQDKNVRLKKCKYKWIINNIITNEFIEVFDLKEWCELNNIKKPTIYAAANNDRIVAKTYKVQRIENSE